jgi:Tfp pilus assembly protein PilF
VIIVTVAIGSIPAAGFGQMPQGAFGPSAPAGQYGAGAPAGGAWDVPPQKPSMTERARATVANNPLTNAWSSWRSRDKQQAKLQQGQFRRDSIALSNGSPPPSPELFIAAAKLSERNGQIDRARQQFHQGLTMAPKHVPGLIEFGRLEDRQGRLPEAEKLYRTAVAVNPHNPTALNDLALCVARQGNLEDSTRLLQQAIDIQPDKPLYRNNMATVLIEQQRDQEALAHLTAVHGPAVANYNVGHLLSKRGRAQDASRYFAAALEIDPQMTPAGQALAALNGGTGNVPHMAASRVENQPAAQPVRQQTQQSPPGPQLGPAHGSSAYAPATAWPAQRTGMRPLPPVGTPGVPFSR